LGSRIVTYADDLVILCRRGKAEEALSRLREIMGKLKLLDLFQHQLAAVMQTRSRKVEMPNGLSLSLAFAMYTLLIGSGRYVSCLSASASSPSHRCTPYASMSAKSRPSTPGAPLLERHWAKA